MRKKKGKKIVSILAATIMTVSVIFGALASGSTPAYAAEFSSDTASATDWVKYLEDEEGNLSTETVGRIWTDKTVSKDSITFEGSDNGNLKVDKQKDSDFLVALSAMSSTSNIMTKTDKPLDVVLVLDMSGSMADEEQINKYEYTPIYESELNTRNTYYLEDEKKLKYDSSKGWYYETGFIFTQKHYVKPKTGPNDKDSSHVQFHTRKLVTVTIDKLPALKKAVNGFIDSTAKINEGIRDDSKKHRISLVKFAGNTTDSIGNDTYRDGGYTYNYSQIVNKLTSDITTVKKNFNELNPAGATRADYGLNHAVTVLNDKDSRPNAQKVVIFFTDGQPTSSSGFEIEVANSAIRSAKTIKDSNTLIYTLGIFADADSQITDDKFNAYMHGVSSNYPEATAYNKLGARAEGSNYYKVAKNADDLNNIFTDIAGEIQTSAQGAPTQIKDGYDTNKSGYITFKDQLGQYVKCDGFTDIVFAGKQFKNPNISSEDEGENTVTTYTFSGKGSNNLYPDGNLEDIIIKVTSYKELSKGDYVEVKVPASLIPVRNFNITDGKMTVTETHPIRILYNASVKDGVVEDLKDEGGKVIKPALVKNPDVDFNEYLRDAKNKTTDGKVKFFSNMWSGGDNGDTTATFEPSVTNSFYRFTDDAQLFIKTPTGKEPVTSIGNIHKSNTDEYFFEKTYYTAATSGGSVTTETEPSYIRITDTSNLEQWMVERDGKVFIKKGTERLLRIDAFTNKEKDNNTTQTAKYVINPIWDSNRTNIIAHLGNNGVATAQVGGAISVSKTAKLAEGMIGPVDSNGKSTLDEQEFTFEIDAKGTADGEYTSVIYKTGADGTESKGEYNTVTFKDGKTTITLKNKERVEIYGIKNGVDYTVTETNQPAGFKQITPADNKPAKGKISDAVSQAEFVNEYKAEPPTEITSQDLGLYGNKTLDGRKFKDGDTFKFMVRASNLAPESPLPTNPVVTVNGKDYAGKDIAPIDFGKFTFSKPGEYRYSITEYLPDGTKDDPMLPSVTYDETAYRLIVNVMDDGNGNLSIKDYRVDKRASAESSNWDNIYNSDNGAAADKGYINFTNKYELNTQKVSVLGLKTLTGKSLGDYNDMQFGFKVEAKGVREAGTDGPFTEDSKQPMPAKNSTQYGDYIYKNSTTGNILVPEIAFATENIGKEYKYFISELQPVDKNGKPLEGATQVDGKWNYKGVTFDNSIAEIIIKVGAKATADGNHELEITITSNDAKDVKGTHFYFTFDNAYNAKLDPDKAVSLKGTKNITGRSFISGDEFKFKVEPQNGAPNSEKIEATVKPTSEAKVDFDFGKIAFDTSHMTGAVKQPDGTYKKDFTYKITEVEGTKAGIKYDNVPVIATVTVTDNGEGKLSATVKYTKADKNVTNAQFTNEYTSELILGKVGGLDVTKTLNGRDLRKADVFGFTIKGITANGISAEEANKKLADSDKSFATNDEVKAGEAYVMKKLQGMKFTQKDAGKTYSYEVSESAGKVAGVTYDESKYVVAIEVIDEFNGKMHTVTTVTKTHDEKGNAIDKPTTKAYDSSKSEKPVVAFVNTYKASSVAFDTAEAEYTKILVGREVLDTDKFTFAVDKVSFNGATDAEALKKMPTPDKSSITLTGSEIKKPFSFGKIEFTEPGVYVYNVKEIVPAEKDKIPGIKYDGSEHLIKVTVTDDGNGVLKKSVNQMGSEFENVYDAKDIPVDTNTAGTEGKGLFTKEVTGRLWADGEEFSFKLTAEDGAPMPTDADGKEVNSVVVTKPEKDNKVDFGFGTITFDKVGEYVYHVKEVVPENKAPGMTYDDKTAILTITVTDNPETGELKAETRVENDGVFTNSYKASSVTLDPANSGAQFTKKLTGRDWKTGETFSFTISPKSLDEKTDADIIKGMPMPNKDTIEVSKPANGNEATFNFGQMQFTKEGVYKYNVKENAGTANGVTYDNHTAVMVVTVKDNVITGKLEASVSFEGIGQDKTPNIFINTYKADPISVDTDKYGATKTGLFTKKLIGRDSKAEEAFNFTLTPVTENAPMPKNNAKSVKDLKNGETQNFGFGVIEFEKAGTYVYNVVEENAGKTIDGLTYASNTAKMTITVTDKNDGTFSTDVKIENGLFENKYNAEVDFGKIGANFNITKSLSGRDMAQDQFSFEVKALDADSEKALNIPKSGETVKSPAANMGEDAIVKVIDKLRFTEKDSNKTYGFTVRELGKAQAGYVYDETMYTVKIKVDDLANGKLKATAKVLAGEKLVGEYTWTPDSEDVKPVVLSFENAYSADNNNSPAVVEATKTLNGRHLKAEEFNFQIKDVKGTVVREAKNAANGTVDFGKGFTYNINDLNEMVKNGLATKKVEDGKNVFTISYTAEEVGNMPAGVTMTAGNFSFNIKVTDNGDGTLATDVVYPEGGIRFVNTYATGTDGNNEAPLQIIGNKVISAEDGLVPPAIDGKFSFTMTGDENAPLPEKATVTNDGAGQIAFGNIKYTLDMLKDVEPAEDGSRSRTFNYTVTESGVVPGITNDDNNTRTFSVTLKDDGVGNLTATPSDSARFTFTNTYGVVVTDPTSITDQIKISKKLTGRELVAEEFKFELVNSENKVVATGTNDAKGKIVFTPMTYDKPGNFTYTVREVANEEYDGVDYDETLFTVNTKVKDNSDGTLSVTHSVDGAEVVFNNKYSTGKTSVVIGAAKKFIGSDLKGGQFKFELKDENGKLVSAAVNDKDGNIIFDEITYDKEGTYKYTISEVNSGDKNVKFDDTVFEVTVKVTDDKKGNLVAKAETEDADGVVFVNTYEKPQEPQTPHQSDDGAKTGDDTPINALVVFMGAAILLMGTLIERRKTN